MSFLRHITKTYEKTEGGFHEQRPLFQKTTHDLLTAALQLLLSLDSLSLSHGDSCLPHIPRVPARVSYDTHQRALGEAFFLSVLRTIKQPTDSPKRDGRIQSVKVATGPSQGNE